MSNTKKTNRDSGNGQYALTGGFERPCRCGHTLGKHTAERATVDGVRQQPCVMGDYGVPCACECFKGAKVK